MLFMFCMTYWKAFHLFIFLNYILVTYLVGMLKINFMFFLERNKTWLIAEYHSISHPKAILYETQGHQGNLSSAALGSSR